MSPTPLFIYRLAVALSLSGMVCSAGCTPLAAARQPEKLADSLQELVPHSDRDHFVYLWRRLQDGRAVDYGVQVEHVTAFEHGEFEVALSEDGLASGRLRFHDTGTAILLLREDDISRGIRLSYDPPMLYIDVPLFSGERHTQSSAALTKLSDGQAVGAMQVTQVVEARPASPVHSALGDFDRAIALRIVRTLHGPDTDIELSSVTVMVPGIGEIHSEGQARGGDILQRELACATIGSRRIGDCKNLVARVQEMRRAGSTDVH